jgi:predicted O-methyltransferase YrrM
MLRQVSKDFLARIKNSIKRALQFLFALVFSGEFKLLWTQVKTGDLGEMTSFIETVLLYRCARQGAGSGTIVEIGSYKGRTTITLALGSKMAKREKIYAVDPLPDPAVREAFVANMKKAQVLNYVIPIFKTSAEARKEFKENIRLLFIDGCHDYERVKEDILLWQDCLVEGGIIALHDYLPESSVSFVVGVNKAADEYVVNSKQFIVEGHIDSLLFASKGSSQNQQLFKRFNTIQKKRAFFREMINKTFLR